ncbi:MAG: hypothetical protein BGO87_09795 [Flavobacteriia bacterium 40-80]|nr:MAG: hypothetical protein BGO87_09795 [Flavobacteriia bacterium 40-80]
MKTSKIWFSLIDRYEYQGNSPSFYPENYFEWEHIFDNKHEIIYNELNNFLNHGNNSPVSYFNHEMVNKPGAWKTVPLMSWGVHFYKNARFFPETCSLLRQIPGLVSISFNLLEPKSKISAHFGDTNAIVRCHYGIKIPGQLPEVGFKVKNEEREWEEGKLLIFCDGYTHTAWNNSSMPRIILLFDVILPEFLPQKKMICGSVLSSIFLQSSSIRLKIKEPPKTILKLLHFFARTSAIILTPPYNWINKIIHA